MLRLPRRRQKSSAARRESSYRPRMELMEDRLLMAVITVTGTGDTIGAPDGSVTLPGASLVARAAA